VVSIAKEQRRQRRFKSNMILYLKLYPLYPLIISGYNVLFTDYFFKLAGENLD